MKTTSSFKLRPPDVDMLNSMIRGNKSFVIREWVKEQLDNPVDLGVVNDNLLQVSFSLDVDFLNEIHAAAAANNMSTMQFVRLIVEKNLRDK